MSNKRNSQKRTNRKVISGGSLLLITALTITGLMVFFGIHNAQVGEKIPIMADYSHIPEGTDPNPYTSNPPTSGIHYSEDLQAGFYADNTYDYPEGYLVHNLEHGYVIFWYNCDLLSGDECRDLTVQIKEVMGEKDNYKLIAYPWNRTETPLVLTSWGRLMEFPEFDKEAVLDFIRRNQNKAPEPHAD